MPERVERLVTGIPALDEYIDYLCAKIDRALNVTAAPPLQALRSASGLHLAMATSYLALAKSKTGGIDAAVGDTPGVGDVVLQDFDGEDIVSQTIEVEALNLATDAVDENKLLVLGRIGKYWYVLWELCD